MITFPLRNFPSFTTDDMLECKRRLTENHTDREGHRSSFAPWLGGVMHSKLEEIEEVTEEKWFKWDINGKEEEVKDVYELREFEINESETIKAYVCTDRAVSTNDLRKRLTYLTETEAECLLIEFLHDYLKEDDKLL